jgi:hypothetical protein
MPREFTPEWRAKLSEAAKRRHREGRNANLKRGGAHLAGTAHPLWKGSAATAAPLHQWLKRHRPKAGRRSRCGKRPPPVAYIRYGKQVVASGTDWANVSGRYDRLDPADWIEVCRSCHAKMDNFAKNFH